MSSFKAKILLIIILLSIPVHVNAKVQFTTESVETETTTVIKPTYDCSAEETSIYIEKVAVNTLSESPITLPDSFLKSFAEQKIADGDGDCVTIFTDGKLSREWERIVEQVKEFDFEIPITEIEFTLTEEMIKKAIKEQIDKAIKSLTKDVCKLVSSENLKKIATDTLNEKYGMTDKMNLIADYREAILEDGLLAAAGKDPKIRSMISEDELKKKLTQKSRDELRKVNKDIWKGL
ncbi:MAG: hypothetical protein HAW67_06675 [Endozoicomonadaceae bacterium]|nr:hypothetical protein [Endozoicomonadaceae bacterium]